MFSIKNKIQTYLTLGVVVAVMSVGVVTSTQLARAQVQNDSQAQISQLLQLVALLQAQLNQLLSNMGLVIDGNQTGTVLSEGDIVKTTANVSVRMAPGTSGALIQVIPAGSMGEIVSFGGDVYSNPTVVNGYTWYRVRYESLGITGWTAGNWLNKQSALVTEPSFPKVTITSVSNNENPTVRGYAYNTNTVGFSVDQGDKVYGSGEIAVVNNTWSHKIRTDLRDGTYNLVVYVNNEIVAKTTFMVKDGGDIAQQDVKIDSIDAKAAAPSEVFAGETAHVFGAGLFGDLIISIGEKNVRVTNNSDSLAQFVVPEFTRSSKNVPITITNSFGKVSKPFYVTVTVFSEDPKNETATYQGFMDGRNFITTRNITRADALDNCKLNARNNPAREISCTWNGQEIHRSVPQSGNDNIQDLQAMTYELIKQVRLQNPNANVPSDAAILEMIEIELQREIANLMAQIAAGQDAQN